METTDIKPILAELAASRILSEEAAFRAFECVMGGEATEAQIGALLTGLTVRVDDSGHRGPTVEEITGAARAMRSHAVMISVPDGIDPVDTCGTGGDSSGTFNISTVAAFIAAGAGVKVAKHGNRSVTSKSGSSQVLEALGVNLKATPDVLSRCLEEAGICFCFAPAHHPAMKYAAPVRQQLGFRTIFNVLGPLTNPAGARRQVMGVFDAGLTEPIARVLMNLGSEHVMVVHGLIPGGGLDEISTIGPTRITEAKGGELKTTQVEPGELGVAAADVAELRVDSVEESAGVIKRVLDGEKGAAREIAAINAAAAIVVAGNAGDLREGFGLALEAIDSGAAKGAMERLVGVSNG